MNREVDKPTEHPLEVAIVRCARDLWELETYLRNRGGSTFLYDEDLDVFRFEEDGRFAFCDEFANWKLLRERGYLDV